MINNQMIKYIITGISMCLISLIIYYYHSSLISLKTFHFITHNIRFYFLNSILYIGLISFSYYKIKPKLILNIIYCISFVLLSFSLFMTHYVHNIEIITLGNIYPMIVYGNYIYFLFYAYFLMLIIVYLLVKRKKRF